jgi:Ca2+-binding EF-hand superfamily protein
MKARQYLPAALVIAISYGAPVLAAASTHGHHSMAHRKAHPTFAQLDKNHDGVITRDEWKRTAKSFDKHDLNHDGKLTPNEYRERKSRR